MCDAAGGNLTDDDNLMTILLHYLRDAALADCRSGRFVGPSGLRVLYGYHQQHVPGCLSHGLYRGPGLVMGGWDVRLKPQLWYHALRALGNI